MVSLRKLITLDEELTQMVEFILKKLGYSMESFQEWIRRMIREKYAELKEETKDD